MDFLLYIKNLLTAYFLKPCQEYQFWQNEKISSPLHMYTTIT